MLNLTVNSLLIVELNSYNANINITSEYDIVNPNFQTNY